MFLSEFIEPNETLLSHEVKKSVFKTPTEHFTGIFFKYFSLDIEDEVGMLLALKMSKFE